MSIWIADPLPVTWTFTVEPPPAPKPKPFYTREPGEIFDHLENGDVPYRWELYGTLQKKQRKFYRRLRPHIVTGKQAHPPDSPRLGEAFYGA